MFIISKWLGSNERLTGFYNGRFMSLRNWDVVSGIYLYISSVNQEFANAYMSIEYIAIYISIYRLVLSTVIPWHWMNIKKTPCKQNNIY